MSQLVSKVKITDPDRILRIFKKISESRMQVFMRPETGSKVVVKGWADETNRFKLASGQMQFQMSVDKISERGTDYLSEKKAIFLEFVLTTNKIICKCAIRKTENTKLWLRLPTALISLERRSTSRYKTIFGAIAFLKSSLWHPNESDSLAPPCFQHHQNLNNLLNVSDISIGGVCFKSFFPSVSMKIKRDTIDPEAWLYLPIQKPITLGLKILWTKKIRESLEIRPGYFRTQDHWLFGSEFIDINEEKQSQIRKFIQKICEVQADESLSSELQQPKESTES